MKILVVSHGDIAKGFCDTAKKFFGIDFKISIFDRLKR